MKKYIVIIILCIMTLSMFSCNRERYRRDRKNKMTRRAKIASNYLSAQAVELTQENIANKDKTAKEAEKRKLKQQEELNELNAKNKVKVLKKHSGKFKIY